MRTIKIFRGGSVVVDGMGNSKVCLKWDGGVEGGH